MRRAALIAFAFWCLVVAGCSTFAVENHDDFFTLNNPNEPSVETSK